MPIPDSCYYLETVAGDGGNHTAAVFWLSPDIILNGGTDQANQTGPNTVDVNVHSQPCENIANDDDFTVDVYVGDPSLVMTPNNTTKLTNAVGRPAVAIAPPSLGSTLVSFNWINGGTADETPGHKCLTAVLSDFMPSPNSFGIPTEPHSAQRNITILANKPPHSVDVNTINENRTARETVTVRAIADTEPAEHVLQAARNVLKGVRDFKRFSTTNLPRFRMEFEGFPDARVLNNTGRPSAKGTYGSLRVPNCETRFEMEPGQRTKFKFQVDLEEANYGDAFIFHLMHVDAKERVRGGLTVVGVGTRKQNFLWRWIIELIRSLTRR